MSSIMVFIPAYCCEKQISRVISQFTPGIAAQFTEIVVVENRSPDRTLDAARESLRALQGATGTLLQNDNNYNLGGSHKVAFGYFLEKNYDTLVVLHGDDQGHIRDIMPYISSGMHKQFDSFLGARFAPNSILQDYSLLRTVGNRLFNTLISVAVHHRVYDMGAGLNVYQANFLRRKFYLHFPDDLTFNVYMLLYSIWKHSPFEFFPLSWREDDQVSNARIFMQAWHILKLTCRYAYNAEALFSQHIPEPKTYTYRCISLD